MPQRLPNAKRRFAGSFDRATRRVGRISHEPEARWDCWSDGAMGRPRPRDYGTGERFFFVSKLPCGSISHDRSTYVFPVTPPLQSVPATPGNNRRPARRPRYSGKNPRKFHEKYKELSPDRYPGTIQKVEGAGKTPAGMHRPICVEEILKILDPQPGSRGVDATLGYGGHALQILERLKPGGFLLGLDTDILQLPRTEARLRALDFGPAMLEVVQTNYAGIDRLIATRWAEGVDFILADLGCSSMQLDDPDRGFTFKSHGPLDMRMNPGKGPSAAQWLATIKEDKLARALREFGDVPGAEAVARTLCEARKIRAPQTTTELTDLVCRALPCSNGHTPKPKDPAVEPAIRRVFQAVRIAVNDEFSALETFLRVVPACLKPGGRLAILTFHSGEDRRVKSAFKQGLTKGVYSTISNDILRPSAAEIRSNPRASSAKLRWAIRGPTPAVVVANEACAS